MKISNRTIWIAAAIIVIFLISVGLILPPLVSTNALPAWGIVLSATFLLALVASVIVYLLSFIQ